MIRKGAAVLIGMVVLSRAAMAMTSGQYAQIMDAIDARDLKTLQRIRSAGVDINGVDRRGMTPLCETVSSGDYEGYEMLLTQGASPYVSCMRQLPQDTVAKFYANQPPAHTYYSGHLEEAKPAKGWAASEVKGFEFPTLSMGELLLGGAAVGAALTLGRKSSSNGNSELRFWNAPLDLAPSSFETAEYTGSSFGSISIDFLGAVRASSAYARGYTGYQVKRHADGTLDGTGEAAIDKTNRVKVAVVDSGVWTQHPDLRDNIGLGYNFVYGVCSDNNKTKCWSYDSSSGKAYLYENWSPSSSKTEAVDSRTMDAVAWAVYSQRYADYKYEANNATPQIEEKWNAVGLSETFDRYYTEESGEKKWWLAMEDGDSYESFEVDCTATDSDGNCVAGTITIEDVPVPVTMKTEYDNHGTHVSGLVAATRNDKGMMGVAYDAKVIPVKIDLDVQSFDGVPQAVKQADITNLSLGAVVGVKYDSAAVAAATFNSIIAGAGDEEKARKYKPLLEGYRTAAKENKIMVFAAGNYDHDGEDPYDPSWHTLAPLSDMFNGTTPQSDGNTYNLTNLLVTVVAVDRTLTKLTDYSARCGVTKDYCIAAPGGDDTEHLIVSTAKTGDDAYGYMGMGGTSQAAPIVSGALAVLKGAFPHLTNQQVVQILFETATDLGEKGVDEVYGHGLVNLEAATNPVGLTKISLTTSTDGESAPTTTSASTIPAVFAGVARALPEKIVVLDKYDRAFLRPTSSFVHVAERENKLDGRFKSFVRGNEKVAAAGDSFKMAYSERRSNLNSKVIHGSMSFEVQPTNKWSFKTFYTENTETAGGTYFERIMQAPYAKMKEAWGGAVSYNLGKNWKATVLGRVGQNGFVDEDDLKDMDHNKVSLFQSSLQYNGLKKVGLKVTAGVSSEQGSTLGMWGRGAFKSGNSRTSFVGAGVTLNLTDAVTIEGMYYSGVTRVNNGNSLVKMSNLKSDSFAVTAAWKVNEGRTLGLQFVSPLRVRRGVATIDLPVARDAYQNVVYRNKVQADLKPSAREYDVGFYYADALQEDVHFQSEVGVRLNPDHVAGAAPDWRALLGLSFGL